MKIKYERLLPFLLCFLTQTFGPGLAVEMHSSISVSQGMQYQQLLYVLHIYIENIAQDMDLLHLHLLVAQRTIHSTQSRDNNTHTCYYILIRTYYVQRSG